MSLVPALATLMIAGSPGSACELVETALSKPARRIELVPLTQELCAKQSEMPADELFDALAACLAKDCKKGSSRDTDFWPVRTGGAAVRAKLGIEGPSGSGHFWSIVYLASAGTTTTGACLSTATR